MIEDDGIIRFSPGDLPDLPEIPASRDHQEPPEPQRRQAGPTPEPEGWMPIGDIW